MAKLHAGFRFPEELITALDAAADAHVGFSRTDLVQKWLSERAVAEGWMTEAQAEECAPTLREIMK